MEKSFWFLAALMFLDFAFSVVFMAWLGVFEEGNLLLQSFSGAWFVIAMLVAGGIVLSLNVVSLKASWFKNRFPLLGKTPVVHFASLAAWLFVDLKWIAYLTKLV